MKLIGNVNDIINDEFVEKCRGYAKNFNRGTRTFEEVLTHTIGGEAVELLVCDFLELNQTDFSVMQYDAIGNDGKKYEIKHTVKDSKWWNFKPQQYAYFLQNAHAIDCIILCYYNKSTGDVFLKFKANAKTFEMYTKRSNYSGAYYNIMFATKDKQCIKY